MTEEEYIPYQQRSIVNYAESKVKSGNWKPSEAMKLSEKTFQDLLPEGVSTLDHYLFTVVNKSDEKVGIIWFNVRNSKYHYMYSAIIKRPFLFTTNSDMKQRILICQRSFHRSSRKKIATLVN